MADMIEVRANIDPVPQRSYLTAVGASMNNNPKQGPLLYALDGCINLDREAVLPSGSRAALQALLVTLAGKWETTTRIVQTQIQQLSCDTTVNPEEQKYLESHQFNNSIRDALRNPSAAFGFESRTDTNLNSAGIEIRGSRFNVNPNDSYNQMAQATAFAYLIENMPVPLFEVTELASGNGMQLETLQDIIGTIQAANLDVGTFINLCGDERGMSRAMRNVMFKFEQQGLIDVRVEKYSRVKPEVLTQIDKVRDNWDDLLSGKSIIYGYDATYVGSIIEAYNQQLASHEEITVDAIYEHLNQSGQGIDETGRKIKKHDISVFLSRLNKRLNEQEIEGYPRVIPASEDEVLIKKSEISFNESTRNIPAELSLLLDIVNEAEYGLIGHSVFNKLLTYYTDELAGGERRGIVFGSKYLDFQPETRSYMVGFNGRYQLQRFKQLQAAIKNFYAMYNYLTRSEKGKSELLSLYHENLTQNQDSGTIGYLKEREAIAKVLLRYYLDITEKLRKGNV